MQGLRPDYVLVFNLKDDDKTQSKASVAQAKADEYDKLVGLLSDAGFDVTSRPGAAGTDMLLVFVRIKDERLAFEVHRDRLADWLNDVSSVPASPTEARDFDKEPLSPSERLRLAHSILVSSRSSTNVSVTSSASAGTTAGLAPLPSKDFPSVTDLFPPHDVEFNQRWLKQWRSTQLQIPERALSEIRDVYGEQIALYFAFLRFYFRSLVFPSAIGAMFYLAKGHYSPVYSFALVMYAITFVEAWRIKERQLSVQWGSYNSHRTELPRASYDAVRNEIDPVTGVERGVFPWYRVLARQLAAVPFLLVAALVLFALISTIYSIETLVGEIYDGPAKRFVTLIPTVLFVGLVPRFTELWSAIAEKLTDWENHEHQTDHDKSLARKVYALSFLVAYGSPLLTAFVYTPFGAVLVPWILQILPSRSSIKKHFSSKSKSADKYSVNNAKLHTQIVAYTLTNQATGAFTEIGLPYIMSLVQAKISSNKAAKNDDKPEEKEFLDRIRHEASLPPYNVFPDYAEMAVQFGYLVLFSAIWPIAPLWSFINNFFELRGDAFKLTHQARRPVPRRDATIGPWLEILTVVAYIGAWTNAALVYLYQPRPLPPLTPTMFGNATMTPPLRNETIPTTSLIAHANSIAAPGTTEPIKHALFMALLVALVAEHAFVFARSGIRFLLEHGSWNESSAERKLRSHQLELKKNYLKQVELRHGPVELAKRSGRIDKLSKEHTNDDKESSFWKQDAGKEHIQSRFKSE